MLSPKNQISEVALIFLRILLFFILSISGTLALAQGTSRIGGGGGFIELFMMEELENLPHRIATLRLVPDLSAKDLALIDEMQKFAPRLNLQFLDSNFPPPQSYRVSPNSLVACQAEILFLDYQRLINHSDLLGDWHNKARILLFEGLACSLNRDSQVIFNLAAPLLNDQSLRSRAWGLNDLYKNDFGPLVIIYRGQVLQFLILDSGNPVNLRENALSYFLCPSGSPSRNQFVNLMKSRSFVLIGNLYTSLRFQISGDCEGEGRLNRYINLRIQWKTNALNPQELLERPLPEATIEVQNFQFSEVQND